MAAVGGSVESITVAGREFPMTGDAVINRKNGGYENDVDPNGDGSGRILKTRTMPMLGGIVTECDESRDDHQYMQDIANSNNYAIVAITYADGTVYEGSAIVTGELQHNSDKATLSYDMKGQGVFDKQ